MIKYVDEYRDPKISALFSDKIKQIMPARRIRLMEVCGGHSATVFKYGLMQLLPKHLELLSGPGCPVCVTTNDFVDRAVFLSKQRNIIIVTFGDMMKVPGSESSLAKEKAAGADIRTCYSPMDAIEMAETNPTKQIVFLGIGFETTAPAVASAILSANQKRLTNFSVLSSHKTMPLAMKAILDAEEVLIDGFICPGHVSSITGKKIYEFIPQNYGIPCVISGFEPVDILESIYLLIRQINKQEPTVQIQYKRAVRSKGNIKAMHIMNEVFEPCDMPWRGLGLIPGSGLKIRKHYELFDAEKRFPTDLPTSKEFPGCSCGDVMRGVKTPEQCPLFGKVCFPDNPKGACMVSVEGTCSTWYKYKRRYEG